MSASELWIVHFTLVVSLSRMIITKRKENARLCSCGIQLLGDFGKDIHHTCGTNQFIQENIFNNDPIRPIAIAKNTNSAFTGSFTENQFW